MNQCPITSSVEFVFQSAPILPSPPMTSTNVSPSMSESGTHLAVWARDDIAIDTAALAAYETHTKFRFVWITTDQQTLPMGISRCALLGSYDLDSDLIHWF